MLFYRYELRWKEYKSVCNLAAHQRSTFEMKYSDNFVDGINDGFYKDYLKNPEYVIGICHVSQDELLVCVAAEIKALDKLEFEDKIKETFTDCDIVHKDEMTIEDYKIEMGVKSNNRYSRKIIDKIGISYSETFFDCYPFKLEESVLYVEDFNKAACKKRAKEILGSKSLMEEIDRIYSKDNTKSYYGHPVQYMITAGEWSAAQDIYKLLISALYKNKRLLSNRISVIREVRKMAYKDERYKQILKAANGGVVIIELNSQDDLGRFATGFHDFTKVTGELVEQLKKDTLFIFVELSGKSLKDHDAINNIVKKADFIQITEGTGTYEQAKNYLMEQVNKVDFLVDDVEAVVEYLPEQESYSVTDIFNAYNAWYGSGLKNHIYKAYKEKKTFQLQIPKVVNNPYEELQDMVGLENVKTVIDEIIAASKVLRVRERMGLNNENTSLHMLFSGNPGTAKTTVARLLARILKEEDAVSSGKFVECGRQDLVGKYVGWTAKIVESKFREAQGGILFIDEAYALVEDGNTYGAEAINTITQLMENYRNDVIVIFAGYPDKMQEFLEQNEGLKSRIAFHLDFKDYNADEMVQIMELMCKKREYAIDEEGLAYCKEIFDDALREENFGNGRYVRNVLEQAIMKQSNRIVTEFENKEFSKADVCSLRKEDFRIPNICKKSNDRKIGFVS